jgi:hypothetical protein
LLALTGAHVSFDRECASNIRPNGKTTKLAEINEEVG